MGDDPQIVNQNAVALQVSDEQLRDLRERLETARAKRAIKAERASERPALLKGTGEAQS
jgi:hypothetical protein